MDEFTVVHEEGELQAGAMRTVDGDEIRVLLSRSEDGGGCAIDNASTHRGGPLDEGERDGNAVARPLTRFPVRPVLRGGAAGSGRETQRRFESRLREAMSLHHDKHHAIYVANLNAALEKHPEADPGNVDVLIAELDSVPEDIRTAVRNNGGGHANHSIFWQMLAPSSGVGGGEDLAEAITWGLGSLESLKERFAAAAAPGALFGSGWAWLIVNPDRSLSIETTANQDSPLMEGKTPVLGLDLWEHAYYLNYQHRRLEYINVFWNVVNWREVASRYEAGHS